MAFNILESVRNLITPNHIETASRDLQESNSGISKAITVGIPAIVSGLISRIERGDGASLLSEAGVAGRNTDYPNLTVPSGAASGSTGILQSLFGPSHSTISDSIGRYAGIKSSSASSLLAMLAPLALNVLGRHATTNNLTSSSLNSLIADHKDKVAAALPSGFTLPSLPGTTSNSSISKNPTGAQELVKPGNRILPIILAVAAIILLIYLLNRGCNNHNSNTVVNTTDTTTADHTVVRSTPATIDRETMKVKLADNTELNAYKGGIEDRLVTCLNDPACKAGKDNWFDFDNINFETGSAVLTGESKSQLNNLILILKAYPNVKIKIGGYTDNTGDVAGNKTLSTERAENVSAAIKADAAVTSRITGAEGYGSEFAKQPSTATDEERKSDRRISVQLVQK